MFKKKQDEWWQRSNEEQNAELAEAAAAAPADADPAAAAEAPEAEAPAKKPKKKSRWDWWDAAGDILEVVLDFVTDLFD